MATLRSRSTVPVASVACVKQLTGPRGTVWLHFSDEFLSIALKVPILTVGRKMGSGSASGHDPGELGRMLLQPTVDAGGVTAHAQERNKTSAFGQFMGNSILFLRASVVE